MYSFGDLELLARGREVLGELIVADREELLVLAADVSEFLELPAEEGEDVVTSSFSFAYPIDSGD